MNSNNKREPIRISISCRSFRPDKKQRTLDTRIPSHRMLHESLDDEPDHDSCSAIADPQNESPLTEVSLPNDIIVAIRSLSLKQAALYYPLISPSTDSNRNLLPFILKPMLYQVFLCKTTDPKEVIRHDHSFQISNANTGVNIEWLKSCKQNIIRSMILLGTGGSDETTTKAEDDIAVMETQHYIDGIWDAYHSSCISERMEHVWTVDQRHRMIQWFIEQLHKWTGSYIHYDDFDRAIQEVNPSPLEQSFVLGKSSTSTSRRIVDYLVTIGILRPRIIGKGTVSDSFWFTLPSIGIVSKALTVARKKCMTHLKRSYYKEIKVSSLMNKRFGDKNFSIPGNFLVRDFISRGIVKTYETPSGEFVRLIQSR